MSWPPIGFRRPFSVALAWLSCALAAALAGAAPAARGERTEAGETEDVSVSERPSLGGRFGLERLVNALSGPQLPERLAAIQRLAGLGTRAALHRLVSFALDHRAQLGSRECLTLARALAPHAADDDTRVLLTALMNQRPGAPAGPEQAALFELARGSAALALAASGSDAALRALGATLRAGGASAALAADALLEYPPADLQALLAAPGEPSVELARWLGELGDQRAFHTLRDWVRGESAEVRAAAAVALTRLGELETVPLARQWLKTGIPVLEHAALEILMLTQQPEAAALASRALASEAEPAERLRRALDFPSPELLPLAARERAEPSLAQQSWTLLGRVGGPAAISELEAALGQPESAFVAAHALSRLPGNEAHAALARALAARAALPLSCRAAALRSALWRERFEALPARLAELAASQDAAARAAAAWSRSLLEPRAALAELGSGDPVRVQAAANNALWFDDSLYEAAAQRLEQAPRGPARAAFAFALLSPAARRELSSSLLQELVLEGGAAAPLALRALAARDEPRFVAFAEAYLSHPDPILRAHAARGLGESTRAASIGSLARGFEFETDPHVRQAIVRALSARSGATAHRTLELAARLDPSAPVRSAARLALGGVELADPPPANEFLWAEVRAARLESGRAPAAAAESEQAGAPQAAAERLGARAVAADDGPPNGTGEAGLLYLLPGQAVPVFADPAGVLVAAGVNLHPLALRWR
ncbi:MAG TPA: HEAT repeat domain-containing protein [Polyangiaceae bacterium]|nr:HEAT repeat domain-containing protein [Polyangiaceae bacterium]